MQQMMTPFQQRHDPIIVLYVATLLFVLGMIGYSMAPHF